MKYLILPENQKKQTLIQTTNAFDWGTCPGDGCGAVICAVKCPQNSYKCNYPATAGLSPTSV